MAEKKKKQSADDERRALLQKAAAAEFVGPPLPERQMASPFAADYVNAPPGYEPAPTKPLDWYGQNYGKGIAPFPQMLEKDYLVPIETRQEAHPASRYYGQYPSPKIAPAMGSRNFFPGLEQVPLRLFDEFYPPPTISNEEQEMINRGGSERRIEIDVIHRLLKLLEKDKKK